MARYQVRTTARHPNGTPAPLHVLTFYTDSTMGTLATLYVDEVGAPEVANPYTTNSSAIVDFWTEDTTLWVLASGDTSVRPVNINLSAGSAGGDYNVKDYGALGNGTADDTAAIQAALDSAATDGGSVYLPAGTYKIIDCLLLPINVSLFGDGRYATTIQNAGTTDAMSAIGAGAHPNWHSEIKDLSLVGTALSGRGIYCNDAHFVHIRRTSIRDHGLEGVSYDESWACAMFDSSITSNGLKAGDPRSGVYLTNLTHWLRIDHCSISQNKKHGIEDNTLSTAFTMVGGDCEWNECCGLYLGCNEGFNISGNYFENNNAGSYDGQIYLGNYSRGGSVSGNYMLGGGTSPSAIDCTGQGIQIQGNWFSGHTGTSILVHGTVYNIGIGQNYSGDSALVSSVDDAIYLRGIEVQHDAHHHMAIPGFGAASGSIGLASGAFTMVNGNVTLESQSSTTDDLDTINGGEAGDLIVLSALTGHTITAKDMTGNLQLASDFAMNEGDYLTLICRGAIWAELSRSENT